MCTLCVEIIRERITIKDALKSYSEAVKSSKGSDHGFHAAEIVMADEAGDTEEVKRLITEGYKKERWL